MAGTPQKASNEQILVAYSEAGSVWGAADLLGMCGQSIHERLVKMGKNKPQRTFTEEQDEHLRFRYEHHASHGTLTLLANFLGHDKSNMARRARELGLTDKNRKKTYLGPISSLNMRRWHQRNEHPRGMLGKTHTDDVKDAMSDRSLARWKAMSADEKIAFQANSARGWKAGWREIGGQRCYFRSAWEANYARYLQWLLERGEIAKWEHEPETFWFEAIRRGTRSYLPDFRVTEINGSIRIHEVKGYMDPASKTKLKRMAKYYPDVVIILIDTKVYKSIAKTMAPMIAGWE